MTEAGGSARAISWADPVVRVAAFVLPFALLHGRAVADVLICTVGALFLLRCLALGDWGWTRSAWVRAAAALWLWLLFSTAIKGTPHAVVQAVVVVRLLLFVAACESWALRDADARRWLALGTAAAAAWIAVESWQQLLFGTNLFGVPRFFDGALTGPFIKPHAGSSYLAGGSSSRLSRHTHWYGGERGEETQLFPMPGLILGRLPLYGRLNFVIGAGHQFAVTPKVTEVPVLTPIYNHAWLISARTPF